MNSESLRHLCSSPGLIQLIKFSVVGCLNVAVSTVVFYLCYERWQLGSHLLESGGILTLWLAHALQNINVTSIDGAVASVAGYVVGMINSFLLNKTWTFGVRETKLAHVWRFVIINLLGIIISTIAIFIFVDMLHAPYMPVWFITITLLMLLNFLGNKYWTFL
ncbi:MAG TPA: GtrA family protein [Aquirhabdus sp.]